MSLILFDLCFSHKHSSVLVALLKLKLVNQTIFQGQTQIQIHLAEL